LCEILQQETGIDLLHVPYRGSAAALTDVITGRVDIFMTSLPAVLSQITAGNLKPIAVVSPQRASAIYHVPTIGEYGLLSGYGESWYGLMVPTGTPPQVIARLNRSINAAWADPALRESLMQIAYEPPQQPNMPATLNKMINEETERWTEVLRQLDIPASQ
jgi:tripartite-type tricarboxylate transporter receptor subunit TctC